MALSDESELEGRVIRPCDCQAREATAQHGQFVPAAGTATGMSRSSSRYRILRGGSVTGSPVRVTSRDREVLWQLAAHPPGRTAAVHAAAVVVPVARESIPGGGVM